MAEIWFTKVLRCWCWFGQAEGGTLGRKFFMVEFIADTGRDGPPKLKFQRVRSDSAVWLRYGSPKFRDVGVGSTR